METCVFALRASFFGFSGLHEFYRPMAERVVFEA